MKRFMLVFILVGGIFAYNTQALAITISLDPTEQSVSLGSQAIIDLNISGLGNGTSVGTYDISVGFDPTILSFSNASFGNQLDIFGLGDIQFLFPGPGNLELFELSLDSIEDLNNG